MTITAYERLQHSTIGASSRKSPLVLHVLDHSSPVLSGYSVRSRNLITAQNRSGQAILAVTGPLHQLDDPTATDVTVDDVLYTRTPIRGGLGEAALCKRWPVIREHQVVRLLRQKILEIVGRERVGVIYAHSPALCGLAALQAARRCGLPWVYEIRAFWEDAAADRDSSASQNLRGRMTRALETYVAQRADAVGAIAKPMLRDLEQRGIPRKKLFHVPNGVDTERFIPEPRDEQLARELNLGEGPVLGFFGSLYRYEGVSWMIRAAAGLRAHGRKFQILVVGRGEDDREIQEAIRECSAANYVRTIDHVPHEQIGRYYSVIDVSVCPRRSIRLTELVTPLKPLEAMALMKPVLASSVGGMQELVEHERTGLLFAAEDTEDFERQAARVIDSPGLRRSLAEGGREFVMRERDWKSLARKYTQIYDFVLSPRSVA
jgi:PEP-CTERM/exosortase A-associated glycosyltransferase